MRDAAVGDAMRGLTTLRGLDARERASAEGRMLAACIGAVLSRELRSHPVQPSGLVALIGERPAAGRRGDPWAAGRGQRPAV